MRQRNVDTAHDTARQHIPQRRCIACGARGPKETLARFVIVIDDGGAVLIRDDRSQRPGRGLYVCRSRACFELARDRRAFSRSARIRVPVQIDSRDADIFDR